MDNSLSNYVGRDDLLKAVSSLEVVQGKAKSSGREYYAIRLTFINGFSKLIFLRGAENFAFTSAFDLIPTYQVIND